jgi:general stress protein 26
VAKSALREMFDLIEGIETAMLATRRPDGHLVSRPMATQARAPGADLWFVTDAGSEKLREIARDPHVNVSYCRPRGRAWVSVSGTARATRHRATVRRLWRPDWALWFPKDGADPRHGTSDDPRMVLVGVRAHRALYMSAERPAPLLLLEIVRARLAGREPRLGAVHEVGPRTFARRARRRSSPRAGRRPAPERGRR